MNTDLHGLFVQFIIHNFMSNCLNFEIRSYGKSELAMLYFPHAKTTKGAMNNLNFWIDYNGELRRKLRELNTPPRAHRYTTREVELIVYYLGEP